MSIALKCDRCGVCFDPTSRPDDAIMMRFQNPVIQNAKDMKIGCVTKYFYPERSPEDYVDLCPGCQKAFERFMRCEDIFKVEEPEKAPAYKEEGDHDGDSCNSHLWDIADQLVIVDRVMRGMNDLRGQLNQTFENAAAKYDKWRRGEDTDGDD